MEDQPATISDGGAGQQLGSDRKIFVGNLPFGVTEEQMQALFSRFGVVVGVNLRKDRNTGNDKGFGFVTFQDSSSAVTAIAEMDGQSFQVRESCHLARR